MDKIGERIKTERLNRDMTQKELAQSLGVTQDSISLWEMGKRIPDTQYIIEFCRVFDISAGYLLGIEDDFGTQTIASVRERYSAEERQLIEDFRQLNHYKQELIKNNIKVMLPAEAESEQKKKS